MLRYAAGTRKVIGLPVSTWIPTFIHHVFFEIQTPGSFAPWYHPGVDQPEKNTRRMTYVPGAVGAA